MWFYWIRRYVDPYRILLGVVEIIPLGEKLHLFLDTKTERHSGGKSSQSSALPHMELLNVLWLMGSLLLATSVNTFGFKTTVVTSLLNVPGDAHGDTIFDDLNHSVSAEDIASISISHEMVQEALRQR